MRDKVISIRVNSNLLEKVNKKIDSHTTVYRGVRNIYFYHDGIRSFYDKFSLADLFEEKLKEYLLETSEK